MVYFTIFSSPAYDIQDGGQENIVKGERVWECLLSQAPVVMQGKENAVAALKLKIA
ncbi:hypothetical protein SCFA_40009 [anaerobic digester metagenome]|jgi:hypothetical protein|uniref:Uncharacterized protein n=1 Tax=anaerobic digester metagenome TaxID=1263854 RepID=A0A485M4N6_9ZZZZ